MSAPLTPDQWWEDNSFLLPEGYIQPDDLEVMDKASFFGYDQQTAALREELHQAKEELNTIVRRKRFEPVKKAELKVIADLRKELEAVKKDRKEWEEGAGLLQAKRSEALKERDQAFDLLKKVQILKSLMGYGEPIATEHEEEAHAVNSLLSEIDYFLSSLENKTI